MKKLIMMVLGLMFAVGMAGMAVAGNIDSPGPPSSGSGMYTLQQVYNYLSAGTTATIPGSFQEPSAGPGSTMKTTTEIVAAVATPFAQVNGPAAADVKKDVKFFSTASGSWGVQTGTAAGAAFGDWQARAKNTEYTAETDGFVVGYTSVGAQNQTEYTITVSTQKTTGDPWVARQSAMHRNDVNNGKAAFCINCPVPAGSKYKVVLSTTDAQSAYLFWLPMGS